MQPTSPARCRMSVILMLASLACIAALATGCTVTFPEQGRLVVSTSHGERGPSALSYDDHPWHDR